MIQAMYNLREAFQLLQLLGPMGPIASRSKCQSILLLLLTEHNIMCIVIYRWRLYEGCTDVTGEWIRWMKWIVAVAFHWTVVYYGLSFIVLIQMSFRHWLISIPIIRDTSILGRLFLEKFPKLQFSSHWWTLIVLHLKTIIFLRPIILFVSEFFSQNVP